MVCGRWDARAAEQSSPSVLSARASRQGSSTRVGISRPERLWLYPLGEGREGLC